MLEGINQLGKTSSDLVEGTPRISTNSGLHLYTLKTKKTFAENRQIFNAQALLFQSAQKSDGS